MKQSLAKNTFLCMLLFCVLYVSMLLFDGKILLSEVTVVLPKGIERDHGSYWLIDTPGCLIPNIQVDDSRMMKYKARKTMKVQCAGRPPLTYSDGSLTLTLNSSAYRHYTETRFGNFTCCYQSIIRVEQDPKNYNMDCDKKWRLNKTCKPIMNGFESGIHSDGIVVSCSVSNGSKPFYQNVHMFLQPRRAEKKRNKFKKSGGWPAAGEALSFVLMGLDSVSRLNMKRHMPDTFRYITQEMDTIDFKGYNKIADNTNPNLLAILSGMSREDHKKHPCSRQGNKRKAKFDDCPLIWKEFDAKGYVTAYAEDSPYIGMFHYLLHGFVKEPTDYYNRPYFQALNKYTKGGICQGTELSLKIIYDYIVDFIQSFSDIPYFGVFWSSSLTHDSLQKASAADLPSYNFLKSWNENSLLNRTILLFMSDHGIRFGDIRDTYSGMIEERMPFVMMTFPKWFRQKYINTWNILQVNSNRLVSNYDLHLTIKDIVNQGFIKSTNPKSPFGHGRSLFQPIPHNRTCADAAVPEHYCACEQTKTVDTNSADVQKSATFATNEINRGLKKLKQCAKLTVKQVYRARMGVMKRMKSSRKDVHLIYRVSFITTPGLGRFEATVKKLGKSLQLSSDVSRINKYGRASHCISHVFYRKYCYCTDLLAGAGAVNSSHTTAANS